MDKWINQIICGDALEILKQMPDGFVDMVFTDPPFFYQSGNEDLSAKKF